jgi:5'-nucleotidase
LLPDETARLINVNLPPSPRGMSWTRQAVRHYDGLVVPDEDPMGRQLYWFTVVPIEETEPGTDLWAFARGYITLTPLSLDLTDISELDRLSQRIPLDEPRQEEAETEEAKEED